MAKRLFDIIFSFLGIIATIPLFLIIAILIKLTSSGPIFYHGVRIGRYGKSFRIHKFRTLVRDAERLGGSSTPIDDPRLTKIGRLLKAYQLDELPQLINVLCGEMSFVGPRPQVPWAVERYTAEERRLLSMRPGMTDWASLWNFHEGETLKGSKNPDRDYMEKIHPQKMKLSLAYIKKHSLWIDVKIIFKTIAALFTK